VTVAAIDIGTISSRLCIADHNGAIVRDARIVRTGEGVRSQKRTSGEALERLRSCLSDYRRLIDEAGATRVRAVSTAVARDAENVDQITDVVDATLGVPLEVLTGEQEARLGFAGALEVLRAVEVDDRGMILVLDVGGGSTEFSLGSVDTGYERGFSADVGAAKLTEAYLWSCLLYTSPSPRDRTRSRMPSSA